MSVTFAELLQNPGVVIEEYSVMYKEAFFNRRKKLSLYMIAQCTRMNGAEVYPQFTDYCQIDGKEFVFGNYTMPALTVRTS